MAKMIRVRGVPDAVHRELKARAARERVVVRPTMREWLKEAREAESMKTKLKAVDVIRQLRDQG